jgi:hypothetical protein
MTLKYIIIKDLGAVLFPESIPHGMVAKGALEFSGAEVESAGFALMTKGVCVKVFGSAVSLGNLHSIPGDEFVINDAFKSLSMIKYFNFTTQQIRDEGFAALASAEQG